MFKPKLLAVALAACCPALPLPAQAATEADLAALRAEFDAKLKDIQTAYEARLKEMESRLLQARPTAAADQAAAAEPAPNAFNPEIALILQGGYLHARPGDRRPTGYLQSAETASPSRGFSVDDSELVLAASIDPYFRGQSTLVFGDGVEVEEAWFQSQSLGHGLSLKGGRFISGIGYQNEQHPHAWDFTDNNLMYQTLFGEHLVQDGLQLKWLAPTDTFLELGAEIGNGAAFPGSHADRNAAGGWALFGHVGGDVGASHAWRAGLSYLAARPRDRESLLTDVNGMDADTLFSGDTKVWIADFVWKWAPQGNPRSRNFKLQAEAFLRKEGGDLTCLGNAAGGGACLADTTDAYHGRQTGWYVQGIYQFAPGWRVGLRHDRLNRGSLDYGANDAALRPADFAPSKWSLMTDYAPSEFSLFRLQLARDRSVAGSPDDSRISLQYVYSLGPHGAHKF